MNLIKNATSEKLRGGFYTPVPIAEFILKWGINGSTDFDILEPSCGDGNFLGEVLIRKIKNGIDFETALSTIYGVDLMPDNVKLCQDRLLCGREDLRHIVEQNIVCADALTYHYRFDGSLPIDESNTFNDIFEFV